MEEGYTNLPTSHLLGSVPAVVAGDKRTSTGITVDASAANLNAFPPTNGSGYQPPGSPYGGDADGQTSSSWKGFFNIASYQPYFNVDTDIVVDRIVNSVYPMSDFHRKIEANPDMYGPVWISVTLVFMLVALGNFGTYLMQRSKPEDVWNFDINYVDWAACMIFGYTIAVPAAVYFLLQYFGFSTSLVRLWCMWGYSLSIFLPTCCLLIIPSEFLRWIIIILAGSASSWFLAVNLHAHAQVGDKLVLIGSAAVLQFALAVFIKIFFFP